MKPKMLPALYSTIIKPEWLDYNDHLNVAYYVQIFDHSGEALADSLGLGEDCTRATGISWMVLESHITYDREVRLGQSVEVLTQLLDHDYKRMHLYSEMYVKGSTGYLASTLEQMVICVDLAARKSSRFPEHVLSKIQTMFREHSELGRPENIGRKIGLRK